MKPLALLAALGLVLVLWLPMWAEPYSPACGEALEQISKAWKVLVPFRRTIELATPYKNKANGEAAACIGEGRWKVKKPIRCRMPQWQAPPLTKDDLAAINTYR